MHTIKTNEDLEQFIEGVLVKADKKVVKRRFRCFLTLASVSVGSIVIWEWAVHHVAPYLLAVGF